MGKASDRWKELIAKIRLMTPNGRNNLLLIGLYIFIFCLIAVDIAAYITFGCVLLSLLIAVLAVVGLLIYKLL